jgi:hypothetical protein
LNSLSQDFDRGLRCLRNQNWRGFGKPVQERVVQWASAWHVDGLQQLAGHSRHGSAGLGEFFGGVLMPGWTHRSGDIVIECCPDKWMSEGELFARFLKYVSGGRFIDDWYKMGDSTVEYDGEI